jgi:hypothetical protein
VAYLDRIEYYRERYRCPVYAYVLMSNHHLLIEAGAVGLSKISSRLEALKGTGYFSIERPKSAAAGSCQFY